MSKEKLLSLEKTLDWIIYPVLAVLFVLCAALPVTAFLHERGAIGRGSVEALFFVWFLVVLVALSIIGLGLWVNEAIRG